MSLVVAASPRIFPLVESNMLPSNIWLILISSGDKLWLCFQLQLSALPTEHLDLEIILWRCHCIGLAEGVKDRISAF